MKRRVWMTLGVLLLLTSGLLIYELTNKPEPNLLIIVKKDRQPLANEEVIFSQFQAVIVGWFGMSQYRTMEFPATTDSEGKAYLYVSSKLRSSSDSDYVQYDLFYRKESLNGGVTQGKEFLVKHELAPFKVELEWLD